MHTRSKNFYIRYGFWFGEVRHRKTNDTILKYTHEESRLQAKAQTSGIVCDRLSEDWGIQCRWGGYIMWVHVIS